MFHKKFASHGLSTSPIFSDMGAVSFQPVLSAPLGLSSASFSANS
jgi:hypothetical protein